MLAPCGAKRGPDRPWLSQAPGKTPGEAVSWRAAWSCDCEGPIPLRTKPVDHERARSARAVAKSIGTECGHEPTGCPWRAWDDPVAAEAIEAYRLARIGEHAHLASLLALNPPHVVYEAALIYDRAVTRAIAARRKRDEAAAQNRAASSKGPQRRR